MNDLIMFVVGMVLVVAVWFVIRVRQNPIEYFKTPDGLGILKGIVLAILFAVVLGVGSKAFAGEWFTTAEVTAGIDHTLSPSPMCEDGGVDDRSTSAIGANVTIYEEGNFSVRGKYTHHSCVFGIDDDGYDGVGIELVYKLW